MNEFQYKMKKFILL